MKRQVNKEEKHKYILKKKKRKQSIKRLVNKEEKDKLTKKKKTSK